LANPSKSLCSTVVTLAGVLSEFSLAIGVQIAPPLAGGRRQGRLNS
jgi:hypothetical protein